MSLEEKNNECNGGKIMRMVVAPPCGCSESICRYRHSIHLFKNKGMVFMPKQDGFKIIFKYNVRHDRYFGQRLRSLNNSLNFH
mgnify:CR=1 FL=1